MIERLFEASPELGIGIIASFILPIVNFFLRKLIIRVASFIAGVFISYAAIDSLSMAFNPDYQSLNFSSKFYGLCIFILVLGVFAVVFSIYLPKRRTKNDTERSEVIDSDSFT